MDKIQGTGFSVWSQTSPRTYCAPTLTILVASAELTPVCPCPSVLRSPQSSRCGLASVGYFHSTTKSAQYRKVLLMKHLVHTSVLNSDFFMINLKPFVYPGEQFFIYFSYIDPLSLVHLHREWLHLQPPLGNRKQRLFEHS